MPVIFVVAFLLVQGTAQDCSYNDGMGNVYNFNYLAGQVFFASTTYYNYTFTACQNTLQFPSGMAQLIQHGGQWNATYPISIYDNTLEWSESNITSGIQFVTQNGAPPLCSPSGKPRFCTFVFICQTGAPVFEIAQEPNNSGCSAAPGYVFYLYTPVACPGYTPPPSSCGYTPFSPCVIQTYNTYAFPGGWTLVFNQQSNNCGSILFSDYLLTKPPTDTCTNTTNGGWRMISHIDILFYKDVVQMLKDATPNNPIIFFWDPDTGTGAIGPLQPAVDEMPFL